MNEIPKETKTHNSIVSNPRRKLSRSQRLTMLPSNIQRNPDPVNGAGFICMRVSRTSESHYVYSLPSVRMIPFFLARWRKRNPVALKGGHALARLERDLHDYAHWLLADPNEVRVCVRLAANLLYRKDPKFWALPKEEQLKTDELACSAQTTLAWLYRTADAKSKSALAENEAIAAVIERFVTNRAETQAETQVKAKTESKSALAKAKDETRAATLKDVKALAKELATR